MSAEIQPVKHPALDGLVATLRDSEQARINLINGEINALYNQAPQAIKLSQGWIKSIRLHEASRTRDDVREELKKMNWSRNYRSNSAISTHIIHLFDDGLIDSLLDISRLPDDELLERHGIGTLYLSLIRQRIPYDTQE